MTLLSFRRRILLPAGLLFVAWLGAARPAGAVITFTSENNIVFSASMTVQAIVPGGAGYRMYLTSGGAHVLSATSSNMLSWTMEAGIRLSTAATDGIDSSSITSVGVHFSTNIADPMRMYYVGISSEGLYSILMATSTDNGTTWAKATDFIFQNNNGLGYLDSPRPILINSAITRLFYIREKNGINNPPDYRIALASSSDGGLTFTEEFVNPLDVTAFHVSVTTLTDGRTRIYYTAPLTGETTASQVLSAISPSASGTSFTAESGVRFSTISATGMSYPVVIRSTENYRWRMFVALASAPADGDGRFVSSALTIDPLLLSMTPAGILNSGTAITVSVTGEILGSSPSPLTFYQVGTTITATGVTVTDDLNATGTINPFGQGLGAYTAVYTNPDGRVASLANAFIMDLAPGSVSILDNLFRPLKGGSAQITAKFFSDGRVTIKIYTLSGGLVSVLADHVLPAGSHTFTWNGRTALGNTVASGVYLISIQGPKINTVQKVVVVK